MSRGHRAGWTPQSQLPEDHAGEGAVGGEGSPCPSGLVSSWLADPAVGVTLTLSVDPRAAGDLPDLYFSGTVAPRCRGAASWVGSLPCCLEWDCQGRRLPRVPESPRSGLFQTLPFPHPCICLFNPGHYPGPCPRSAVLALGNAIWLH